MIELLDVQNMGEITKLGIKLHENFTNLYNYESLMEDVNKTYVYKLNNIIIGFIHIQELIDEVDIIDIVIAEEYRRKGYGSKLLSYVLDMYKDKKFILEVSKDNSAAISLYHNNGFNDINVRKGYYNGIDAIIMEKK